jgi:hypothetical protein
MIQWDANLTAAEKELAASGESTVTVRVTGMRGDVLRDGKSLLRYLGAIMGDDGVVAIDHTAQRMWSRGALDDELCHDADLDIESLYTTHAVGDDATRRVHWLHTHGLAEMGFFDFDILNPPETLDINRADAMRVIAFAIVEGVVTKSTASWRMSSAGAVRFIDVGNLLRRAEPGLTALRVGADEERNQDRAIICEPARGLLGRWLDRIQPSKMLAEMFDKEEALFQFSPEATLLMAERARLTYPLLRRIAAELAEFELPVLVKLGYTVAGGAGSDKEHLWFKVHELFDDSLDATLLNEPFAIPRLKAGQRDRHRVALLSDWTVMTPVGAINPRDTRASREIRARRDEFRGMMTEARKARND